MNFIADCEKLCEMMSSLFFLCSIFFSVSSDAMSLMAMYCTPVGHDTRVSLLLVDLLAQTIHSVYDYLSQTHDSNIEGSP